jgi:hypothetical protein
MDEAELARQMEKAELENAEIGGALTIRLFTQNAPLILMTLSLILGDDDQSDMEAEGNEEGSDGEEEEETKGADEE